MIKTAADDGYVPLQVFVPVMDAIAPDTGTQSVYLKLDFKKYQKSGRKFAGIFQGWWQFIGKHSQFF